MRDLGLSAPKATELKPRIVVFGVGGAGGNAVNNMITASLEGCDFVVANTDAQHLTYSKSDARIQLGRDHHPGPGAGAHPEVGMNAAEESAEEEIYAHLDGAHMVFITAGMGGGTGTGAQRPSLRANAPAIAAS
jgi:cell division protein FtsZ